jgi:hypothetical protein
MTMCPSALWKRSRAAHRTRVRHPLLLVRAETAEMDEDML